MSGLPVLPSHLPVKPLMPGAKRFRVSVDHRGALTLEDIIRFCEALYTIWFRRVDRQSLRAIFLLFFFGLMRPGELVRGSTPQHQIPVNAICVAGPAPHSFAFI